MFWVWTVSLPITFINSPNVTRFPQPKFGTGRDVVGLIFFIIGLAIETIADQQKYAFRSKNQDKNAFMKTGLFIWSRHPNYFGEIILHFGIWMICLSPATDGVVSGGAYRALYASILGPIFLTGITSSHPHINPLRKENTKCKEKQSMTNEIFTIALLMFVSGLPLQERPTAKRRYEKNQGWEEYSYYLHRTSILIPLPPALYEKLPTVVKRTILLEVII